MKRAEFNKLRALGYKEIRLESFDGTDAYNIRAYLSKNKVAFVYRRYQTDYISIIDIRGNIYDDTCWNIVRKRCGFEVQHRDIKFDIIDTFDDLFIIEYKKGIQHRLEDGLILLRKNTKVYLLDLMYNQFNGVAYDSIEFIKYMLLTRKGKDVNGSVFNKIGYNLFEVYCYISNKVEHRTYRLFDSDADKEDFGIHCMEAIEY